MKDIPVFTTENGVASLVLREIPYSGDAYIRLQATENPAELIQECLGFCRACGAEQIYATGDAYLEQYPVSSSVIEMCAEVASLDPPDAFLFPITGETASEWRNIYNEKMRNVPNASYMTEQDIKKTLEQGSAYFVHRDGCMLGIGKMTDDMIEVVASVAPGGGRSVVLALASLLSEGVVKLTVSGENHKAINLYTRLGFTPVRKISIWHKIL